MKNRVITVLPVAITLIAACGNNETGLDSIRCGEGTMLVGSECVADIGECLPGDEGSKSEEGLLEFDLTEHESAYEELAEGVAEMDAADGAGHLDQQAIADWAKGGITDEQMTFLFDHGDEITEIEFMAADGAGSLTMPDGTSLTSRFTRTPTGERFTGPNARSCLACHDGPLGNGGGANVNNVMQDPEPGIEGRPNVRQTIAIQGGGLIQILAEEMTEELLALKSQALANPGVDIELLTKGVSFGSIRCNDLSRCNYTDLDGISPDLVVRPMGWKGNFPTLRGFSSDASFGEMGVQPDEILWKQTDPFGTEYTSYDGDGDGVDTELSVGDITALTVYLALQEMPTTVESLADQGLASLSDEDRAMIQAGEELFSKSLTDGGLGCAECHVADFQVGTVVFEEPSTRAAGFFADQELAARDVGYTTDAVVEVDLSIELADFPRVVPAEDGSAVIEPYTDLKRHFMGSSLADDAKLYFPKDAGQFDILEMPGDANTASADLSTAIGRGEFLTPELWGVGTTAPYMHDGRALTLTDAILAHGDADDAEPSEALPHRNAFAKLSANEQRQVVAFLKNLVLVDFAEEEEE